MKGSFRVAALLPFARASRLPLVTHALTSSWWGFAALLLSCTPTAPAPPEAPAPERPFEPERPSEVEAAAAAAAPAEAHVGTLSLTKGAQGMLDGALLDSDDMEARFGPDWRNLKGCRIRLQGTRKVHHCRPQEQCLMGGEIPYFENVRAVEICRRPKPSAWPHLEVDCPDDGHALQACLDDCATQSDACNSAARDGDEGRGRLCVCGCAKISCQQSCEAGGEALFLCR